MIKYILAIVLLLSLIGVGVIWLSNLIIQTERAKVLQAGVELVKERDKIDAKLKTATPADICRRLGGVPNKATGECD